MLSGTRRLVFNITQEWKRMVVVGTPYYLISSLSFLPPKEKLFIKFESTSLDVVFAHVVTEQSLDLHYFKNVTHLHFL